MSKPEKHDESHDNKRREFLRGSALLGASASIMASTSASAIATEELPVTETAPAVKEKKGYQVSEHVKAYYRIAAS